jgi:CBS domain-containing protein
MKARDVMTTTVVSVELDAPITAIAKTLIEHRISAVPVIDHSGAALGMVSEGDLIGRDDAAREARRDWWLAVLAEGEGLSTEFLANLKKSERRARDVMAAPAVTVGEDADLGEVARLLTQHRIKRVPVVHAGDGHVVGIVSRADLVRAMASEQASANGDAAGMPRHNLLAEMAATLDRHFIHASDVEQTGKPPPARPEPPKLNVADFRGLVATHEREEHRQLEAARQAEAKQRRQRVTELIDAHISDGEWRAMLHKAREAAERGGKEFMLLRFPSELCSDGGRAINTARPDWPLSLRGEAAEMYVRWERELKPQGFHLAARVLDFSRGVPGDVGLFLAWGE